MLMQNDSTQVEDRVLTELEHKLENTISGGIETFHIHIKYRYGTIRLLVWQPTLEVKRDIGVAFAVQIESVTSIIPAI